jgi:hypothetical protein
MAISGTLLKINGTNIGKLVGYEVDYQNLYSDADRNMQGDIRATFIGWFPKINLTTRNAISRADLNTLIQLLKNPNLTVQWYDIDGSTKTGQFYAASFKAKLMERDRELYESFSCTLTPLNNSYL